MKKINVAILDMNEGMPNQGMRCIRDLLENLKNNNSINLEWEEFEVRKEVQIPSLDYDIYISSGGPGSPLSSLGSAWEIAYFKWLGMVDHWNKNPNNPDKKFVFLICHSFQLACRYFEIGEVIKRKSTAFGVFPIHMLKHQGETDPIFNGLADPFYGVDSRDYQVIQTNKQRVHEMGGEVLCIEKERPHIDLERAVMAIRFNPYMIGTQFHPEADAQGMSMYLQREDKKQTVIENHGLVKWTSMLDQLNDPDKISLTNKYVLPNFLMQSIKSITNPFSLS